MFCCRPCVLLTLPWLNDQLAHFLPLEPTWIWPKNFYLPFLWPYSSTSTPVLLWPRNHRWHVPRLPGSHYTSLLTMPLLLWLSCSPLAQLHARLRYWLLRIRDELCILSNSPLEIARQLWYLQHLIGWAVRLDCPWCCPLPLSSFVVNSATSQLGPGPWLQSLDSTARWTHWALLPIKLAVQPPSDCSLSSAEVCSSIPRWCVPWKYGLSLQVSVIKAKANFSMGGYLSSTPLPRNTRLV